MAASLHRYYRQLHAVVVVSRLSATVGYNFASVLLAVGLGARVGGLPSRSVVWIAGGYAAATVFAKLQASVADAIHDREVDAVNPEKSVIANAVCRLGPEWAWPLFAGYLATALVLYAAVAAVAGLWVLLAGITVIVLGITYSYPPRLKERGLFNHLVTTGVDAGLLVLPVATLVAGRVAASAVVAVGVLACYSFGYHLLHQAADVHYDRQAGVETFATETGIATTVAIGTVATAASAGFALALGYGLAAVVLGGLTVFYLSLFSDVRLLDPETASSELTDRFSIAWAATLANGSLALAVWRRALGEPVLTTLL